MSGIGSGCGWTDGEWFGRLRGVGWTGRFSVGWEVFGGVGGLVWTRRCWVDWEV